jgi:hypothetical protein
MRSIHRFDLSLPAGAVWLDLPCDAPAQGLQLARAWAAALPVLAALEDWWGAALPHPQPLAAQPPDAACLRLPFAPDSGLAGGAVGLAASVIPRARPAPAALPLQWPQLAAQMCLQTLPAERVAAEGLVPGAVLLLPAAYSRRWAVRLQAAGAAVASAQPGWLAPARWWPEEGQVQLHGEPAAPATDPPAGPWSVWLVAPFEVDLRAWCGGGPVPAQAAPGLAELRHGEHPVAWGRLLPCGAGWALRLDRVATPQEAAAWI